jgi:hypothetical protein
MTMKRAILIVGIVAAVAGIGLLGQSLQGTAPPEGGDFAPQAQAAQQARAQGRYLRLLPEVIVDPVGFEGPMAAVTLLTPWGWSPRGGAVWGIEHACTNGLNFNWQSTSPDGRSGIALLPQYSWDDANYPGANPRVGCQMQRIESAQQFLVAVANQQGPGVRVLDYRQRPDLVRKAGIRSYAQPGPGGEVRGWGEGGVVLFEFRRNGIPTRAILAGTVQFHMQNTQSPYGMMTAVTGIAYPQFMMFAPAREFNAALFEAMLGSMQNDPEWGSKVAGHSSRIMRETQRIQIAEREFAANMRAHIERVRDETWSQREQSAERRMREFGELMRNVETFVDADAPGGTREFNAAYDNAWRLRDGSYLLSTDRNFDPWQELQIEGRRLAPLR